MTEISNILLVDPDPDILHLLTEALLSKGFRVSAASSGLECRRKLNGGNLDLLLLAATLPDGSGLDLARQLRSQSDLPIILLSHQADPVNKAAGLEAGADDYIVTPFDKRELLARVRSLLRRSKSQTPTRDDDQEKQPELACFEGWQLDLKTHELTSPASQRVHLTSYEYRLLAQLVTHPNQALGRTQMMEILADRDWHPYDRGIDVMISKLRKKIGDDPKRPYFIKTLRGTGYLFAARVEFQEDSRN